MLLHEWRNPFLEERNCNESIILILFAKTFLISNWIRKHEVQVHFSKKDREVKNDNFSPIKKMKLRTIMKGGGVFTQQSVRLSNFQIKIRFAGTRSWKRGNWLRLGSLVTFFGLGFHDLHYSHEKVCLLMTAVYLRRMY